MFRFCSSSSSPPRWFIFLFHSHRFFYRNKHPPRASRSIGSPLHLPFLLSQAPPPVSYLSSIRHRFPSPFLSLPGRPGRCSVDDGGIPSSRCSPGANTQLTRWLATCNGGAICKNEGAGAPPAQMRFFLPGSNAPAAFGWPIHIH